MQQKHCHSQHIRPTRLVRFSDSSQPLPITPAYSFDGIHTSEQNTPENFNGIHTPEQEPPSDISLENTNIMHLSGMMQALRVPQRAVSQP
ncbi:MAG TPA: hypothetical protein VGN15_12465, partial [Ktedonobacteraceae bacterium]|nr:hypothetical protein [Ktedonobacteraceae bacterium]